jgi:transcription initiation factor TFIID subunit 13
MQFPSPLCHADLRIMMYGYGDAPNPLDETVDLVEVRLPHVMPDHQPPLTLAPSLQSITIEYLKEATLKASLLSHDLLKSKMDEKDLLLSVRKDMPKFSRVKELLIMQETIADARKAFKEDGEDLGTVEALAAEDE